MSKMKEFIEKSHHIVIFTHMAPDGDAMGSSLALWHWCKQAPLCPPMEGGIPMEGRAVTVIVPNAFPDFLGWLPGADQVKIYEKEAEACNRLIAEADLFLCTDFNDPKRIGPMGEKMLANRAPKVLIDHHLLVESQKSKDRDEVAQSPKEWYTEKYVDSGASSACEIVYRLIAGDNPTPSLPSREGERTPLSLEIATCIYTGLMTDTGNFSYNSTNAELYDIVASLLRAGVQKDEIYNAVFNQFSSDRMRLTGYALYRKMRIYPEYHLALIRRAI